MHVEFDEGLRAEGGVGGDGDAFGLGEVQQALLREVGVVFDLEGGGASFGVAEEVHEELAVEVADADALGQALALDFLHGGPGLLDAGVAGYDVLAVVGEAGGVADGGVDVFEGDGEVNYVEVEVVDAPVLELFFANWLDFVAIVEGVPEFRYEKEIFTFDEAVFNGTGDALAGLYLVTIIWER